MIKHSFIDNALYGTEDVNNITKNLVGAGIAPFPTKDTYTAEDLNGLTSALVGSGTSLDGCKCTVSGTTVTVAPGIIYFSNGVVMTVDSENGGAGCVRGVQHGCADGGYCFRRNIADISH